MVAGKSNVSKYKNTTNVAWSPLPPKEKKKEKTAIQKAVERNKKIEDLINQM